ncbi:MAG: glutaredoxin [Omnitrophica WOR_2 bacterium GWA2_47_8]|nr:MAG: glutaredoxin [Omnitrophica WOR_2 bacterium GWA2_47_8]
MPALTLYYRDTCPYCQKVLNHLKQANISVTMKNVETAPANREELITIGGKGQIPCLVIDGKALYESDGIVTWFKKNYKK